MSYVNLIHPSGKIVKFEFNHAQRILDLQRKKNINKSSSWKMEVTEKKKKEDDIKQSRPKSDTKESS